MSLQLTAFKCCLANLLFLTFPLHLLQLKKHHKIKSKWLKLVSQFSCPVVDVIKLFLEGFWKIQIFPKAKTARNYFKSKKQFRVQICLKLALFLHFSAGSDIRQTLSVSYFWGNLDFLQKKFYDINYKSFAKCRIQ